MNTRKGWIATTFLTAVLVFSTTTANAGIIFAGRQQAVPSNCTETSPSKKEASSSQDLGGIIFAGLTGIIFAGFGGIIFTGGVTANEPVENCGIIFGGS